MEVEPPVVPVTRIVESHAWRHVHPLALGGPRWRRNAQTGVRPPGSRPASAGNSVQEHPALAPPGRDPQHSFHLLNSSRIPPPSLQESLVRCVAYQPHRPFFSRFCPQGLTRQSPGQPLIHSIVDRLGVTSDKKPVDGHETTKTSTRNWPTTRSLKSVGCPKNACEGSCLHAPVSFLAWRR